MQASRLRWQDACTTFEVQLGMSGSVAIKIVDGTQLGAEARTEVEPRENRYQVQPGNESLILT
ncbi:MAG TPA: hypothetical protein DEV81_14045 [Cyanobacteria bacterium UBA11049]|nr:hypothetical protein [Cyanobacteria bacterium UBA11049]